MRRTTTARWFLLCQLLISGGGAAAAIRIRVAFTVVENEIIPVQRISSVRHTSDYTLEGRTVRMSSDTIGESEGAIGSGHLAYKATGGPLVFQSTIRGNRLILREIYSTEVITTTIDTNGRDACAATRQDVLKPGQRVYQSVRPSDHQRVVALDRRYEDVTCTISN